MITPTHSFHSHSTTNTQNTQVRLPVRCEALLRLLLECLRGASSKFQRGGRDGSSTGLRGEMYVCLMQYMHFCRCVLFLGVLVFWFECLFACLGARQSNSYRFGFVFICFLRPWCCSRWILVRLCVDAP